MSEELRDAPPTTSIAEVLNGLRETSVWQEGIYKDIHVHPELSFQETRTAALVASKLKEFATKSSTRLVAPESWVSCGMVRATPYSRELTWTPCQCGKTRDCYTLRHEQPLMTRGTQSASHMLAAMKCT